MAVLGDPPHAGGHDGGGAGGRHVGVADGDRPAGRAPHPGEDSTNSVWPLPETPATPTISPAATSSETALSAASPWGPSAWRSRMRRIGSWAARLHRLVVRRRSSGGRPSSAPAPARRSGRPLHPPPRRDAAPIRWLMARTSASLWLMTTTAIPSPTSRQGGEQGLDLVGDEDRGGLVEDEDAALAGEGLEDLDPLLLPHRQVRDPGRGSTWMPKRADASSAWRRATLRSSRSLALAEDQVLGHRHGPHQGEVLGHHAHPRFDRVARRADGLDLVPHQDLARVGMGQPVQAIRMAVVLPAPFSPSRAWTSPARTSKSIRSLATRSPKRLVMPRSGERRRAGIRGASSARHLRSSSNRSDR